MEVRKIQTNFINLFQKEFCYKNLILPIEIKENVLIIGVTKGLTLDQKNYIKLKMNKAIKTIILNEKEITKQLDLFYFQEINKKESILSPKFVDDILTNAINKKSSDIHIEPKEKELLIKFRINGKLVVYKVIKIDEYEGIANKIKIIANLNISEKRKAQDGSIPYKVLTKKYDLRVSTILTVFGEKIVIRILHNNLLHYNLKNLNFSSENLLKIIKLTKKENGIVLVSGPTGSGKSTTLYSMLNEEDDGKQNITTIENPVEISFQNFTQISTNPKVGLTFSSALKHCLRQDPDIIMIGEIRDEETAKIALNSASTGHKVYSTIHTNSFYEVFSRLKDMGVENHHLINAVKGIIIQRLIGKLCENCKEDYFSSEEEIEELSLKKEKKLYFSKGCNACDGTGINGRIVLSDVLIVNKEEKLKIKKYLQDSQDNYESSIVKEAKRLCLEGVISFNQYMMVKEGLLDD